MRLFIQCAALLLLFSAAILGSSDPTETATPTITDPVEATPLRFANHE